MSLARTCMGMGLPLVHICRWCTFACQAPQQPPEITRALVAPARIHRLFDPRPYRANCWHPTHLQGIARMLNSSRVLVIAVWQQGELQGLLENRGQGLLMMSVWLGFKAPTKCWRACRPAHD